MDIQSLLGDEADALLSHESKTISKDQLHPGSTSRLYLRPERPSPQLRNRGSSSVTGLPTRAMSILPVDQGIEHTAAASFAPNPEYSTPRTS